MHGNCYTIAYNEYLSKSESFNKKYCLYFLPMIQDNQEKKLPKEWLKNCDLYIYQDIRYDNSFSPNLSDKMILPQLKEGCQKIAVPNLVWFGRWLFPQLTGEDYKKMKLNNGNSWSIYLKNNILEEAYSKHFSLGEMIDLLSSKNLISKKVIYTSFEEMKRKLVEREKSWDVKISDFILKNYKIEKLFADIWHPSPILMQEICNRLGQKLKLEDWNQIKIEHQYAEDFVLPCVQEALELEYQDIKVRTSPREMKMYTLREKELDYSSYIQEYFWWYHEVKIQ